ncbi:hypothetical protein OJF2_39710 [Aquisphaera giovannonii]|uniref:Uncharacterized protein n=1 Tax=Aquisphaera giovannonii TaxID=406548 RepID=A0A5B9W5K7_9BACT|nr:hypothetical protein [Aquisphaera giovannonii]QEH35419.1 hypothetical protein OJF2_39710 [Aquisphaera giovannonii]
MASPPGYSTGKAPSPVRGLLGVSAIPAAVIALSYFCDLGSASWWNLAILTLNWAVTLWLVAWKVWFVGLARLAAKADGGAEPPDGLRAARDLGPPTP